MVFASVPVAVTVSFNRSPAAITASAAVPVTVRVRLVFAAVAAPPVAFVVFGFVAANIAAVPDPACPRLVMVNVA